MQDQHYTITLEVHSRTPLEVADDLADMLEKVGNEVLETPYPYDLDLSAEKGKAEDLEREARLNADSYLFVQQEMYDYLPEGEQRTKFLEATIEDYRKLGVQALKIAHILEQYRKQETGENENE